MVVAVTGILWKICNAYSEIGFMARNDSQQQQDTGNKTHNYQLVLSIMAPIAVLTVSINRRNGFTHAIHPVITRVGAIISRIDIRIGQK